MSKDKPKNWWDEDEVVAASATKNWWDEDEPASKPKVAPAADPMMSPLMPAARTAENQQRAYAAPVQPAPFMPKTQRDELIAKRPFGQDPVDRNQILRDMDEARQNTQANRQARREAATGYGAGMDMIVSADEGGNMRPGTPQDQDLSKAIIGSPIQIGQGLAEGTANAWNNGSGIVLDGVNWLNKAILGDNAVEFKAPRIEVPKNVLIDEGGPLESEAGALPRFVGQIASTRAPLGKVLPGGGMGAEVAKESLSWAAASDPQAGRVSDAIPSDTPVLGVLADVLRSREGDNTATSFAKNALENAVMSAAALGFLKVGEKSLDAIGGVKNAVVPPNGKLTPSGSTMTTAERRALDIVIRKLKADGVTIDDIKKTAAALGRRGDSGVYETLSEVVALTGKSSGANTRGLAMAGGAAPGPLQDALVTRVTENAAALPQRVSRAATRATGQKAENAVDTLKGLDDRLRAESAPLYDAAYAEPLNPQTFQNELLPTLNTQQGKEAAAKALSGMRTEEAALRAKVASRNSGDYERAKMELDRINQAINSLDGFIKDPLGGPTPSVMALDHVKRAFDDQIEAAGFKSYTGKNLISAKSNFAESLSHATGGKYGQALGNYEDINRLKEAFDFGVDALQKKTWQLKQEMDAGLKGRAWSSGEIEAVAMGVARNIEDLIEANDQAALTKLLKGKALENIATALGSDKAAKMFEDSMRRLGANRDWGRRVAGGSDTAMRQAAIRDANVEGEDAITRVFDKAENGSAPPTPFAAAWEALGKPAVRAGREVYQHLRYPGIYNEEVNAALAPLIARPMSGKSLDALVDAIKARQIEKSGSGPLNLFPSSPPKALPSPSGKGGSSQSNASPTVGGIVVGAGMGAAAPADNEDDRLRNIAILAGLGGAGGAFAGLKMRDHPGGGPKPPSGGPPRGPVPKAPVANGADYKLSNLSPGDRIATINKRHQPAGPNLPLPYWDAATAIKRNGGDRAAATAELQKYADYLKKTKTDPAMIENVDRTIKAVDAVDPVDFNDAAFNASMKGKIEADGTAAMEQAGVDVPPASKPAAPSSPSTANEARASTGRPFNDQSIFRRTDGSVPFGNPKVALARRISDGDEAVLDAVKTLSREDMIELAQEVTKRSYTGRKNALAALEDEIYRVRVSKSNSARMDELFPPPAQAPEPGWKPSSDIGPKVTPFKPGPKPPVKNGIGSPTKMVEDAYSALKQMILGSDARHLNPAAEVLQSLPPAEREWIIRNAAQENPQAIIEAGQTPQGVAELLGQLIRSGDDKAMAGARAHQQRLADAALDGQRGELVAPLGKPDFYGRRELGLVDPINADPKSGPIGPMEKAVATPERQMERDAWFPAREQQRDDALTQAILENQKPGGGIPTVSPELDRMRDGLNAGYERGPIDLPPQDAERLRAIILDPKGAQQAADLVQNPVRPWVSEAERRAIDLGTKGVIGGGALAAAVMGRDTNSGEADSLSDMVRLREASGETAPQDPTPPMLGQAGPYEMLPDGLMPTANPAQAPPWLNGSIEDTRIRAQQRLMALGYAPMKLPTGKRFDDGQAGTATRAAVEAYQRDNRIPVTGELDPITLRNLLLSDQNYGPEPFVVPRGATLSDAITQ